VSGWRGAVFGRNRLVWGAGLGVLGGCGAQPWRSSGGLRESEVWNGCWFYGAEKRNVSSFEKRHC